MVTVLLTWIVATWLRPTQSMQTAAVGGGYVRERYWDERWQHEEEGLWEWLEDRVGLNEIPQLRAEGRQRSFEKSLRAKTAGTAIKQRQMEEAIDVLKERLEMMEKVVDQEKGKHTGEMKEGRDEL
jgi:hypothetical protein